MALWIPLCVTSLVVLVARRGVVRPAHRQSGQRGPIGDLYRACARTSTAAMARRCSCSWRRLPYAIAGLLTATAFDPFTALKLVALLASLASGLGMYALVFGETRNRHAALLAAMVFLARTPYRNGNLFVRGDIGEFVCLGWLPVAIALYRAIALETLPGRARWWAAAAAIATRRDHEPHDPGSVGNEPHRRGRGRVGGRPGAPGHAAAGAVDGRDFVCAIGLAGIYVSRRWPTRASRRRPTWSSLWAIRKCNGRRFGRRSENDVPGTRLPSTFYRICPVVLAVVLATAGLWCNRRTAQRSGGSPSRSAATALTLKPGRFWNLPRSHSA